MSEARWVDVVRRGMVRFDFLSPHGSTGPRNTVQVIDPQTRTISTFGFVPGAEELLDDDAAGLFSDAVLAEDGLIVSLV